MSRRPNPIGGLAAMVAGLVLLGSVFVTPARAAVGFNASSAAHGVRVQVTLSQAPLVPNIIDGGGPTAQTVLDSLGTANALAAFPYPGELLLGLPGLASGLAPQVPALVGTVPGLLGGLIPGLPPEVSQLLAQVQVPPELVEPLVANAPTLPPYPFAAQADGFGQPTDSQDLGFGRLDAAATTDAVTASAVTQSGASGVFVAPVDARSSVIRADDGSVVAEAVSTISGLQVGPVLLGSVRSLARIELAPDGALERSSEFRVSGIQVGALTLDLTQDGFSIGGTPVPAPIADLVNGALAGAGLELTVLPEEVTETSVIAGGIRLTRAVEFGALGTGEMSFVLGQASASMQGAPIAGTPSVPSVPTAAAPAAASTAAPGGAGTRLPTPGSSTSPASPVAATPGAPAAAAPAAARGPLLPVEPFDAADIYLVIVGAALAAAGSGQVLRFAAFRPRPIPATA